MQRQAHSLAHQPGAAERAVQPGQRAHLEYLCHAAPFLADLPGEGAGKFHLGTRVGAIAQLVLQALDAHGIQAAIRQHARHEQAGEAGRRLRQHQEGIAHRRRKEPLVADHAVAAAPRRVLGELGARGIGAHVRAALLFGHAHAHGEAGFFGVVQQPRVVAGVAQFAEPLLEDRGVAAQGRRDRVGHRDRAQCGRFEFGEHHERRRALDVRAGAACPRRAVQARADRRTHQRVVARMEFDAVDTVALAIMRQQPRRMHVGQPRVRLHRRAAPLRTEAAALRIVGGAEVKRQRILQRAVAGVQVVVGQWCALVGDLMRRVERGCCGHRGLLAKPGSYTGSDCARRYRGSRPSTDERLCPHTLHAVVARRLQCHTLFRWVGTQRDRIAEQGR